MKYNLNAADFNLPPIEFVKRVFTSKFDRPLVEFDTEIDFLAYRLTQGASRLEIISAVERLAGEHMNNDAIIPYSLTQHAPPFLNADVLEAFAPDDDEAFVDFCCERILGKKLPDALRIQSSFELRKGSIERADFIESLRKFARFDGTDINLFKFGTNSSEISSNQHVVNDGSVGDQYVFLRTYKNGTRIFSAEGWHQKIGSPTEHIPVHPGWLFSGPKKNIPAGQWIIGLDCAQESNDQLVLDVVADCGLSSLLDITLNGSCIANFSFQIKPEHSFVEIRLRRTDKCGTGSIQISNFSMRRGDN
ncbi:TPA: hypothetical protein ACXJGC_003776 [Burkholderia cenocepacia]|uniref:hypothetical protein n=1 Tax=Burkholderia cenocepacia TaxID=95486 RepID=UPI001639DE42|nr:hypothetical protein [Burkholderia cenocepacia]